MPLASLAIVAVVTAAVDLIAYAAIRALDFGDISLAFVVGAIVGSWTGFYACHRAGVHAFGGGVAALIGAAIAIATIAVGIGLDATRGMRYPEITLPIAALGSFVFPFVLRGTAEKAFAASRD